MSNEITLRPSYWASVSGGKDSLYMLKLILSHRDLYPLDGVVHFELEIDFPFIKDVIDYMESECKKYGIKFVRVKPRKTWEECYNAYGGFPARLARWCNKMYKLDAKRQLQEFLAEQGAYLVSYIGYCYDEVKRYTTTQRTKAGQNNTERYPLVDFGINESEIWQWAKTVPIFNNYYKVNRRCGCMYCPMMSRITMAYLYKYYPDNYAYLIDRVRETEIRISNKYGKKFCIFDGHGKYDADYLDNIVKTKWLKILNEKEAEYNENIN